MERRFPQWPGPVQRLSGGRLRGLSGGLRFVLAFLLMGSPAFAVLPDEVLDDPGLETRARELSRGLRCVVCRNESIDESNADIAREMRLLVRERLVAGDADAAVLAAMVDRYGEYVLLDPVGGGANLILWGAPLALLLLGGGVAAVTVTRRRPETARLSADEEARVVELMSDGRDR